jgi:hypothetical protein
VTCQPRLVLAPGRHRDLDVIERLDARRLMLGQARIVSRRRPPFEAPAAALIPP